MTHQCLDVVVYQCIDVVMYLHPRRERRSNMSCNMLILSDTCCVLTGIDIRMQAAAARMPHRLTLAASTLCFEQSPVHTSFAVPYLQ